MSNQFFPLLGQADEDALHYARLLSVEERPFQRITRRLLAKDAMTRRFPVQLPTPPPDATDDDIRSDDPDQKVQIETQAKDRAQWKDDLLLDFQALESTLMRIQLLKDCNERERQRYATEKSKILETAQAVRDNTAELRIQLTEAQQTLALRKEYDQLAEKIVRDNKLKPRDEQSAAIDKLNAEIADLESEGREYGSLWAERRTQFVRVMEEGQAMIRLIKGEKDVDEEDDEADDEDQQEGDSSMKGDSSRIGTPRPDAGDATPVHISIDGAESQTLGQKALLQKAMGLGVGTPRTDQSRGASPLPPDESSSTPAPEVDDTEMEGVDSGKPAANTNEQTGGDQMDMT